MSDFFLPLLMRIYVLLLLFGLLFSACQSRQKDNGASKAAGSSAQAIVDKTIAVHGGEKFNAIDLAFNFRDKHYTARRNKGLFTYTRSFTDSTGQVKDVLTNDGFTRTVDGKKQTLPAERIKAFTSSVNSVIYFALLPTGLNDPAVQKHFLGTTTIKNVSYDKIKVTFNQKGGGDDFQDQFLYWINQKSGTMDYLAYTYATDGGGIRFRQAINPRVIKGIRFQDYINYEPTGELDFLEIEKQFEAGKLKELSRIELANIEISTF